MRLPFTSPSAILCALLAFLVLAWMLVCSYEPTITHVTLHSREHPETLHDITLPSVEYEDFNYRFPVYTLTLDWRSGQTSKLSLTPDDCVRRMQVDGKEADLSAVQEGALCDWQHGFTYDFRPYLTNGTNTITITIENLGRKYGLRAHVLPPVAGLSYLFPVIMMLALFFIYDRALRPHPLLFAIAWGLLSLMFVLMMHKDLWKYTYDLAQHAHTTEYYSQHFHMPPLEEGREAHQPPLYYLLAGFTYRFADVFAMTSNETWRSVLDLDFFLFALFLLYGLRMLLYTVSSQPLRIVGTLLIMAWPANLIHGMRMSNDILLYLTFIACLYHLMRWYHKPSKSDMSRIILWLGAAFATKNSSVLVALCVLLIIALRICRTRTKPEWLPALGRVHWSSLLRTHLLVLLVLAAGISAGLGRTLTQVYITQEQPHLILRREFVHTLFNPDPVRYFTVSIPQLMHKPYIVQEPFDPVNTLFWNYYLRSVQFGEYAWEGAKHASVMNMLMLAMYAYLAIAFLIWVVRLRRPPGWAGYFGVLVACCIGMLMINNMLRDVYLWADARHVYPVAVLFLLAYLNMLQQQQKQQREIYNAGLSLLVVYLGFALYHLACQLGHMPPYNYSDGPPLSSIYI